MSVNVKLGTNIITGVDSVQLEDAVTSGVYHNFTIPNMPKAGHFYVRFAGISGSIGPIYECDLTVTVAIGDITQTQTKHFAGSGDSHGDKLALYFDFDLSSLSAGRYNNPTITITSSTQQDSMCNWSGSYTGNASEQFNNSDSWINYCIGYFGVNNNQLRPYVTSSNATTCIFSTAGRDYYWQPTYYFVCWVTAEGDD